MRRQIVISDRRDLPTVSGIADTIPRTSKRPYLNKYLQDDHNQFTVPYKNVGLATSTQAVKGVVKSAENCGLVSDASVSITTGTGTTSANGRFSLEAVGPTRYLVHVKYSGYGTVPNVYGSAVVGQPAPMKVMMSTTGALKGKPRERCERSDGVRVRRCAADVAIRENKCGWNFQLRLYRVGDYKVSASLSGLPARTTTTSITTGKTTSVDIELIN